VTIDIDVSGSGRAFEGIGAVSSGASTRLLLDYPPPQRSAILDYLFRPRYGANLQSLKVEIGGDTYIAPGSEPSHMHRRGDESFARGFEWWLMKEAKDRNPDIALGALAWGAPGWLGDGVFFSDDTIDYIVSFVRGAAAEHGLKMDYVGIWNEADIRVEDGRLVEVIPVLPGDVVDWIKRLGAALQPLGTKLVAADHVDHWTIVDQMMVDPGLARAIDVVGVHYPGYVEYLGSNFSPKHPPTYASSENARRLTKHPLWASEDGPIRGDWFGAQELAKMLNGNYIAGRMTKTEIWALISAHYPSMRTDYPRPGLMTANTPWSGHYAVGPAIWAVAHTTQFAQPGWSYIDTACGFLGAEGSYVTLRSPAADDVSVIVETIHASGPQTVEFRVPDLMKRPEVAVWRTDEEHYFEKVDAVRPDESGRFKVTLEYHSIYSLTTTSGQGRGVARGPEDSIAFPFPYSDDFEEHAEANVPKYFADVSGSFEIDHTGAALLEQMVDRQPIWWLNRGSEPLSILGDPDWTDYRIQVEALLEGPGSVRLLGRLGEMHGLRLPPAYQFSISQTGEWALHSVSQESAQGRVPHEQLAAGRSKGGRPGSWRRLALEFDGAQIRAYADDTEVPLANVSDTSRVRGMVGLGTGWNRAKFRDLSITPTRARA